PISLPLEPIPSMAFQPAPDADDLSDFLPPQALELHVTTNTDELVTTATLPNAPLAIHFDQAPVSLMLEADTFAQPVQLSFKLLASTNLT
ncbi:hypothetical protein RZS08_41385, partial [Arthrospira platensis SPKY1]|nr:hypothetical protein [Arthrospira platensis SPKY1]